MLRLVFASVSILALANCDALWSSYEVPCDRGFSCPDGSIVSTADMAGQGERDGSTSGNEDGSTTGSDGSTGTNDLGPPRDMFTPLDGPTPSDMVMLPDLPTKLDGGVVVKDMGTVEVGDLGVAVKAAPPVSRLVPARSLPQGQAVVSAGRAKR